MSFQKNSMKVRDQRPPIHACDPYRIVLLAWTSNLVKAGVPGPVSPFAVAVAVHVRDPEDAARAPFSVEASSWLAFGLRYWRGIRHGVGEQRRAAGVSFLAVVEHQDETRAAYDGIVELYASMFADRLETQPFARAMVATFAELVRGTGNPRAADVGCGPGHLTAMLHDLGLDAFGLDLSPAMVDHARRAHPALRFDEARMEALPVEDGALGGVLAHYSMIHTPPGELPALLAEQARALAPGGLLLASFFGTDGPEPVRFDHKVAPAYSWPADRFAELLAGAGLVTFARLLHDPASERGFLDTHLLARLR